MFYIYVIYYVIYRCVIYCYIYTVYVICLFVFSYLFDVCSLFLRGDTSVFLRTKDGISFITITSVGMGKS